MSSFNVHWPILSMTSSLMWIMSFWPVGKQRMCGHTCCANGMLTCSWDIAAFSMSMEEIHSPPDLMTSLLRSVMRMKPSGSTLATSPVLNQLSGSTALLCLCCKHKQQAYLCMSHCACLIGHVSLFMPRCACLIVHVSLQSHCSSIVHDLKGTQTLQRLLKILLWGSSCSGA